MADDPYAVLGVARNASDDDVRKAFRRLAKENHPDVNPANPAAVERFKKITQAYDIVGDAARRRQFDAGEIDERGDPRRAAYGHGGFGPRGAGTAGTAGSFEGGSFSDIFSDMFGQARGRGPGFSLKGQDVRYTLEVDFLDAIQGVKKRVTMPGGGALDLAVPEGVQDNQVLRLKGKGVASTQGGEAGDALVEIRIKPHPQFKRVGDDITVEIPITIDEAVLGGKIEVPTVSGRVQMTIPKGASSGKVLRLKGKGVRSAGATSAGDQLITLRIVLPDEIDDSLSYFFSEWRQKNAYDPGRK